jgi:hypothetical protein
VKLLLLIDLLAILIDLLATVDGAEDEYMIDDNMQMLNNFDHMIETNARNSRLVQGSHSRSHVRTPIAVHT